MAREDELVVESLDGELLIYDLRSQRCHALNGTSALVWQHCDGTRTVADLATFMQADDAETGRRMVWLALKQLGDRRLLIEPAEVPADASRRELLRRVAIAGAVVLAVPLVRSINAPAAAQAATCLPKHAPCFAGFECCSGWCHPSGRCG